MYRPSTTQPRGAWARHLDEQRRLRDLSQTQAFELVYKRIGWSPKSRTAYVAIDKGDRQPKPEEAAVLAEEFGWPPEPQGPSSADSAHTEAGEGSIAAVLAALAAQTEALTTLAKSIDAAAHAVMAGQAAMPELLSRQLEQQRADLQTLVEREVARHVASSSPRPTPGRT